jgi:hypothetical protein
VTRSTSKKKKRSAAADTHSARVLWTATWALTGAALLAALEPYVWLGALLRELGFQLAILALISAAFALARRAWVALASLLVLAGVFAFPLLPLYRSSRPTPQAGPLLRVATAHLGGVELPEAALRSWLAHERPDALVLTGVRESRSFAGQLGSYRVARGTIDLRALLLVQSALVVPAGAVPTRERAEHPSAIVRVGRCQARIVGVELPPLAAYTALAARERAIARLDQLPRASRSVWLGHFGSRAEAHDLAGLVAQHALRDGRLGHGRLATAPSALGGLGFPLSQLFVHGWISVREMAVQAPLAAGAQGTLRASVELTEPRCRFTRGTPNE